MHHAGQPLSELDKCTFLLEALSTDAGGMYAAKIYVESQPDLGARTFLGLINHVHIHARNQSITAQALHYSPALVAHIPASPPLPALAVAADEHAALIAKIAQLEKDNAAMKTAVGKGKKGLLYCWVHGTCYHSGKQCTVMLADTTTYTKAHLNSRDASKPAGGSTRMQK